MEPILDQGIRNQVRQIFADLQDPVELMLFTGDLKICEYCEDAKQLLEEVRSLSDKIKLSVVDTKPEAQLVDKIREIISEE